MTLMATVKAVARGSIPRPPKKAPITITPSALNRLTQLQKQQKAGYLKIGVRTKGCSGNAYSMDWVQAKEKLDEEVKINDELKLLIDSKALFTLLGSQMDYVEEKLSSGFVFQNPNVKETCGCGLSFIV